MRQYHFATCISFLFLALFFEKTTAQPTGWSSAGIGGGGALFMPSISPHNNSEFYISCDMTDLFHSTNSGGSWSTVHFNQLRPFSETQVQFTSSASVQYAVHNDFEIDARVPRKSTDGGANWADLASDPTGGGAYSLYADPASTNRLLVSSYSELYFSSNGGTSFTQVYSASDLYIAGVFWDGANIFVGCRTGLLVSTNNGASFSLDNAGLPASSGFLGFTGAKEGGTTRLFGVVRDDGSMWPGIQGSEYYDDQDVYRRDFGSGNWTLSNSGIASGDFPFFAGMAQNDVDIAYIAGATAYPSHPTVYKTTDGGANWVKVLNTNLNNNIATGWMGHGGDRNWGWAECAMGFTVCPNNPSIAIITDFGFAHVTTNGGTSWSQAYADPSNSNPAGSATPTGLSYLTSGLNNTASWWLCWSGTNLYGAYTDITGVRSLNGGATWKFSNSGNSYNSTYQYVKHPGNSTLYACVSSVHDMYQSTYLRDAQIDGGTGEILFSTNSGNTWSSLENFAHPVIFMAIDPNNTETAYASVIHSSAGGIYKTTNLSAGAASNWVKMPNPPRTEGHPYNVMVLDDGSVVCTYSGRRTSGGAFTASSGVFYSTDGGTTWADRSHSGMLYWTKDLTIDPHDATQNTWYVGVFSGWGGPPNGLGGIYKTTNRGISWTKINDLDRVEQVAVHPQDADILYVCTEYDGLWYSSDGTAALPTFSQVSSYGFQHPMRVFFNPTAPSNVWVTSFGNSMSLGTAIVLSVEIVELNAYPDARHVELEWLVEAEKNCARYEVERSTGNGSAFKQLGAVAAVGGTGLQPQLYRFDDHDVAAGTDYYYRLKMVDTDGSSEYSKIIHVRLTGEPSQMSLQPNPARDFANLTLLADRPKEVQASILDLQGKVFYQQNRPLAGGQNEVVLDLAGLEAGVYLVVVEMDGRKETRKLVVRAD